jgi:hypothetical protein
MQANEKGAETQLLECRTRRTKYGRDPPLSVAKIVALFCEKF